MQPFIKGDYGARREALLESDAPALTPEALTEWQQRVAWIYFLQGDDVNARAMAAQGAQAGTGDWAVQADWVGGLAAWRQKDCAAAGAAFVASRRAPRDVELRAAGLYWASRADMACGRPAAGRGAAEERRAVRRDLLRPARAPGARHQGRRRASATRLDAADWDDARSAAPTSASPRRWSRSARPIWPTTCSSQQAKIGDPRRICRRWSGWPRRSTCPRPAVAVAQLPARRQPPTMARAIPTPNWTPDGGWRVDKALVYAHTLQESRFRTDVVSPAGAYGLMQIMPAAATDYRPRARHHGRSRRADHARRSTWRSASATSSGCATSRFTGGLLPKVIAAYNAGPVPVSEWNAIVTRWRRSAALHRDHPLLGDARLRDDGAAQLLDVRGARAARQSASRAALAQGMWPKFPGHDAARARCGSSVERIVERHRRRGQQSCPCQSTTAPRFLPGPDRRPDRIRHARRWPRTGRATRWSSG